MIPIAHRAAVPCAAPVPARAAPAMSAAVDKTGAQGEPLGS